MSDVRAWLTSAADHLDYLYEGARHIPTDLVHDRDFRMGLVRTREDDGHHTRDIALFFYGGAAEVFMTLGPAALPLLATLLRTEAGHAAPTDGAVQLADHILKIKEQES